MLPLHCHLERSEEQVMQLLDPPLHPLHVSDQVPQAAAGGVGGGVGGGGEEQEQEQ